MDSESDGREEIPMEEIDIEYIKSGSYQEIYANGVYGGITPRGDLMIDLISEYAKRPSVETYKVEDGSRLGERIKVEGEPVVIRERQASLFMQPNNARGMAEWVLSKVLGVPEKDVHEFVDKELVSKKSEGGK